MSLTKSALFLAAILAVTSGNAVGQVLTFDDVTVSSGIPVGEPGHGVAISDFDRDGWEDILFVSSGGRSALLRNMGNWEFEDVAEALGLDIVGNYSVGLFADLNGDSLTDLFFGQRSDASSKVFLGTGSGVFEDATNRSGIDSLASVVSAAYGDYDNDGAVDLFLATRGGPDLLYRNISQEHQTTLFADISEVAGISGSNASVAMQASWSDFDRDGDLDLFCVHDGRTSSRLYLNSGELPFSDVASSARIDTYPSPSVCCNMGIAWADFEGTDGSMRT